MQLDLWYVEHWTFGLDMRILTRAVVQLLRRDGVHFSEAAASAEQGAGSLEPEAAPEPLAPVPEISYSTGVLNSS